MAGSTTKKAVIQRYQREPLAGYVNPVTYLQPGGVELLLAQGDVINVPYEEIKTVAFVRDFEDSGPAERRTFYTRPKMEGLWVSFQFRDGEILEGVMANNLLQLEDYDFTISPPDPYSNHQRIFIPKAAVRRVEVLGVVGSPLKKRKARIVPKEQIGLFDE